MTNEQSKKFFEFVQLFVDGMHKDIELQGVITKHIEANRVREAGEAMRELADHMDYMDDLKTKMNSAMAEWNPEKAKELAEKYGIKMPSGDKKKDIGVA